MDPNGNPRHERRDYGLKGREITGVDNGRSQFPEQPVQRGVEPKAMARSFAESDEERVSPLNTRLEPVGDRGECHHPVTPAARRHPVDEVDDAVLEPSHREAVHDVQDEPRACGQLSLYVMRDD